MELIQVPITFDECFEYADENIVPTPAKAPTVEHVEEVGKQKNKEDITAIKKPLSEEKKEQQKNDVGFLCSYFCLVNFAVLILSI